MISPETYSKIVNNGTFLTALVGIFFVLYVIAIQLLEKNKKGKKSHA